MQLCPWEKPLYYLFSSNIPSFFFYSHLPAMFVGLIFGVLVFRNAKENGVGAWLLTISVLFFGWGFIDLILWATNDPRVVMFFWSMQILFEALIYIAALFMSYGFLRQAKMSLRGQLLAFIIMLPLALFLPSKYSLIGVTLNDCVAIEGFFAHYYTYIVEITALFGILFTAFKAYDTSLDSRRKNEIKFFTIGMILFLLSFSSLNIVGSFTDDWALAQAGLIGMPIFIALLSYIIVRFKSFNMKVLGAEMLVAGLLFLVMSMIFVRSIASIQIIIAFTLLFIAIIGYQLLKSVRLEVAQRERLEVLRLRLEDSNTQLESANEKLKDLDKLKTEFLSLASHQLRSPLTAIKGYASMVLEGDFGEISTQAKDAVDRIFQSSQNLAKVVEDLLNVSKIEQGGMKYVMAPFSVAEVARDMAKDLSITAEKRGLKMIYEGDDDTVCMVNGDKEKIRQVVLNFIDNSIKYTKEGSVTVSVHRVGQIIRFKVSDTGMGMTKEIMDSLFQKFSRGDGARMNTSGSGLGLYLAKEIVEAHKGKVFLESEGPGKGSTFGMELEAL